MARKIRMENISAVLPILKWLPNYKLRLLRWDLVAGITLASFVLPESMAYATLAGLPTYYGIYSCLAGGLIFALFTTSKQVAVGPTSSISLMIGSSLAVLSGGDPQRWLGIAELTAMVVAFICFIAFIFRLSSLVNFISDSILLGFKAGAALSIMATQLPKLFGVESSGANFFSRMINLFNQLPEINWTILVFGLVAIFLLIAGDLLLPGRPVSLLVVILSIISISLTNLSSQGIHLTGPIPAGLPTLSRPALLFKDVDGVLPLAFACFLMGYIETISAARTFALKNNYAINPRQELLSLGFGNLASSFSNGYVASGGLSQSTVNDKSGAKTSMSLIVCSVTLMLILLFLTGLLRKLPEVILAVIVLHAVSGLIKIQELRRIYRLNQVEFWVAMTATGGVLLFGILKGVMIAVIISLVLLIRRMAHPQVVELGRIGDTVHYSDILRHPNNIVSKEILVLRIESSILYFNTADIQEKISDLIERKSDQLKLMVLDLSASPYIDVAGSEMLVQLANELNKKNITLKIVDALSNVRDLLRKQGLETTIGHISRKISIQDAINEFQTKTVHS